MWSYWLVMSFKRLAPTIIIIACMTILPMAASADDTGDQYVLDTLIVTSPSKRAEDQQKSPSSITYFSAEDIDDSGMEEAQDLIQFTPNLHSSHNMVEHSFTIRGVNLFFPSLYSPVGFYVDGVSYPLQFMHNPALYDLESIEVLRGPQGTLYGHNTESGLVSIITKQPGNDFEAKILGEYGAYNTLRAGASVRGPLVKDTLYLGLALQKKISDGFIKNVANDDDQAASLDHTNGRVSLRLTPGERLDVNLTGSWLNTDDNYGTWRYLQGPLATNPHEISQDEDQYSKQEGGQVSLRASYDADYFTVTSITGYTTYSHDAFSDMDFTASPALRRTGLATYDDHMLSQELRISSPDDNRSLSWVAGIYGFSEQLDTYFDYNMVNMGNLRIMQPNADISSQGMAVFGQMTYTLFEKLRLNAGLRFDHQQKDGKVDGRYLNMATLMYEAYDCDDSLDFNEWLPKFSVSYDVTDEVMTYASVSRGYNAGGFIYTPTANFSGVGFAYDSEYTWNYEAGIKTSWFGNRLRVNLTAFHIEMIDKQVSETDQITFQLITTNAGKAHSQGFELELAARPVTGLDIFGGFGYCRAEFDEFTATETVGSQLVEVDYSGNMLQYAPEQTYHLGMQYQHQSGVFGRVDWMGRTSFYGDYANTVEADGYQTVNLRLGYKSENLNVALWCDNVFDEDYLTYITPMPPYMVGVDGNPRTIGITVSYRF